MQELAFITPKGFVNVILSDSLFLKYAWFTVQLLSELNTFLKLEKYDVIALKMVSMPGTNFKQVCPFINGGSIHQNDLL